MKNPVSIRLFASACPRNDFYLERVAAAAAELGLACTLEKVTDEEEIAANGLTVNCLLSYCPGCRAMRQSFLSPCALRTQRFYSTAFQPGLQAKALVLPLPSLLMHIPRGLT